MSRPKPLRHRKTAGDGAGSLRPGLTAKTVIDALEVAEDHAAFEMAVTADYDAQSAVEQELVLRPASLLWRLRRATTIESGLFKIQARHLLQFRQRRRAHARRQAMIDGMYRNAHATEEDMQQDGSEPGSSTVDPGLPRPERLQIQPMISHAPLSACPTCPPIPSTG
jgi:hypothetical protein